MLSRTGVRAAKTKQFRVLVIEDLPQDVILINHALREGGLPCRSKRVHNEQQFLHELEDHPPDVILSDHGMPGFDSYQALKLTRERFPDIPFLFVTGRASETATEEALAKGADDLIPKTRLELLVPAIYRSMQAAEDRGRIRKLKARLQAAEQKLDQQELQVARLQRCNREIEQFASTVAQDVLKNIKETESLADLIERSRLLSPDAKARGYLSGMLVRARNSARLSDSLLTFSRIGHVHLCTLRFGLNDTVQEAIRDLWRETEGRHVEWRIDQLPEITADPALMLLVMTHLLGNALQFTRPRPHPIIEVGSEPGTTETTVWVRDNGIGLPAGNHEDLFWSFERAGKAGELEGAGIGLAIVRRAIERQGGRVWADGEPDKGATFCFTLPMKG